MRRVVAAPGPLAEHFRLMKRLGTDDMGVPRILGISIPIYTDFMEGQPYAKAIIDKAAAKFEGDQREFCGPYTVKRTLASGAFGEVSEVINSQGISFASKFFQSTAEWGVFGEEKSSFYSSDAILEIDILSRTYHPNVMSARKVGDSSSSPKVGKNSKEQTCVILDMGRSLSEAIREGSLKREKAACDFVCGLNYLHNNSIIHRDLKPGNCLALKDSLIIIDFGMALNVESAPVEAGGPAGTPGYIDPEVFVYEYQRKSFGWNYSSDIYSAGWILAYLLFGINMPEKFYSLATASFRNKDQIIPYLKALKAEGFSLSKTQKELLGGGDGFPQTSNFIERHSERTLLIKHFSYVPLILKMLSVDPDNRPTISQVVDYFSIFSKEKCEKSQIIYEYSPINFRGQYTKSFRKRILMDMTSNIQNIQISLLACTADILDRIVATSSSRINAIEDLYQLGFIAKYLALSVLGYGASISFEIIISEVPKYKEFWKASFQGPLFAKNMDYVLGKLNYRIFRPTLKDVFDLPQEEAKQFIYDNLSPQYMTYEF